jgi:hypothetical protein
MRRIVERNWPHLLAKLPPEDWSDSIRRLRVDIRRPREGGVHRVGKRVFAAQPFLNLSQFLEELPAQAIAAGTRNDGAPSQSFVRHNGERGCEMGAQFLSQ